LAVTRVLTIGTRGSKLALTQTEMVRQALLAVHPGLEIAVERITTKGDVLLDRPLSAIGDKGLFVAEIEQALREERVDLAVHSSKDLPSELPPDMALGALLPREDPRDVLVSRDGATLDSLPQGARVGTSSLRRTCQLLHARSDLQIQNLRGNVDTRLRKLHEGQYDAIVLAAAGLHRLGLRQERVEYLDPAVMLPAVAQGAMGVEIRAGDERTAALLQPLDDPATRVAVTAERAFLARVGGGCQVPVGAYAELEGETIRLSGMIGARDGQVVRGQLAGRITEPKRLGGRLAQVLLDAGGYELLPREDQSCAT
jgi:hydroxymethylbilane synthase